MGDIVWEDPSEKGAGRPKLIDYLAIFQTLKDKPDTWAMVYATHQVSQATSVATQLRRLGCTTTQRKQEDNSMKVYARYESF